MKKKNQSKKAEKTREGGQDEYFRQQLKEHAVSVLFFTREKDGTFIAYTQRGDAERRQHHLNRAYNLNHSILEVSK